MAENFPIIPTLPDPPIRNQPEEDYADTASVFVGALVPWGAALNTAGAWVKLATEEVETNKQQAAQSVADAANQVTLASSQADRAYNEAERSKTEADKSASSAGTAEAAALVAQNAAGIPADYTGLAGMPLSVNPEENGTHFADPIFPYKVVTSNYTAKPGEIIAADIRTKNITVTLPANPAHRSKVTVFSYARAQSNYALTIARNGKPLMRLNENMEVDMPFATVKLVFDQSIGWILYE